MLKNKKMTVKEFLDQVERYWEVYQDREEEFDFSDEIEGLINLVFTFYKQRRVPKRKQQTDTRTS